ncbi:hypothetical protein L1987_11742 [Smallanthus sonchifolius]|uniref:Uncharacterized protein n=1 Tax=Smallanthus sonchifolius TaxID=185202 RepID=A0ACB9JCP4_9ASTR|nr:hypothetical protein L1987_11742 [Smallanthus sonchifolius]
MDPLSDETIWKRLSEVAFDEESIKRRDKGSIIAHIAKFEAKGWVEILTREEEKCEEYEVEIEQPCAIAHVAYDEGDMDKDAIKGDRRNRYWRGLRDFQDQKNRLFLVLVLNIIHKEPVTTTITTPTPALYSHKQQLNTTSPATTVHRHPIRSSLSPPPPPLRVSGTRTEPRRLIRVLDLTYGHQVTITRRVRTISELTGRYGTSRGETGSRAFRFLATKQLKLFLVLGFNRMGSRTGIDFDSPVDVRFRAHKTDRTHRIDLCNEQEEPQRTATYFIGNIVEYV